MRLFSKAKSPPRETRESGGLGAKVSKGFGGQRVGGKGGRVRSMHSSFQSVNKRTGEGTLRKRQVGEKA